MKKSTAAVIVVCSGGVLLMGSSSLPTPPQAPRKDHVQVFHGQNFVDPYFWLREKGTPEVEKYLEAENAYLDATSGDTKAFSEALYGEMLARIKQTDLSVPVRIGGFYYYRRTLEGLQYPIRCRKPAGPQGAFAEAAPEQVLLDQNELAKGLKFLSIGEFEVSDDDAQLAYSTDTTGFRQYSLFVKDLKTGSIRGPLAERVTSAAWAADNRTVFYVTEHPVTKRSDTLWRLAAGAPPVKVHEEQDELFSIGVFRTKDKKFVVLGSRSTDTWDRSLLSAKAPEGRFRLRAAARAGPQVRRRAPRRHALHPHQQGRQELPAGDGPARRPAARALEGLRRPPPGRAAPGLRGLQGLPGGPGEAGGTQPSARPRLRLGCLEGGRLPGAGLRGFRGRHAGVRLEALPLQLPEPGDTRERLRLRHGRRASPSC